MRKTLSFAGNILRSNFVRPPFPYKLTFAVTYRCNQTCRICHIWKKKQENEMSLGEIEKFFEKSNRFNWIDLTGGEVTLREDFVDIAKVILHNCKGLYLLHFPTNGLLTDRVVEICRDILLLKPKRFIVSVSLDGPPLFHDKLRGNPGSFEKSLATFSELKKFKDRAFDVYFGTTVSPYNHNLMQEMMAAAKERIPNLEHRDFHMNIAHESPHYYGNALPTDGFNESVIAQVRHFQNLRGRVKNPTMWLEAAYLSKIASYLSTGKTPVSCHSLSSSCFIAPDGKVFPCTMFDHPIGVLKEMDYNLSALWRARPTIELCREIRNNQCPQCWTPCEAYQSILGNLFKGVR